MNAKLRALMLIAGCTASGLSLSSCKEEETEENGFACIELRRGEGIDSDPFVGTAKIQVSMSYDLCLQDYYANKHPEFRPDGPADAGGALFEEWKTRLCEEDPQRGISCEVESFAQTINPGSVPPQYKMTITYNVLDPALEGKRIIWGPAPLEAYAECDPGDRPFVRLTTLNDIIGTNGAGDRLWNLQAYGMATKALIQPTASGCLQVPVKN